MTGQNTPTSGAGDTAARADLAERAARAGGAVASGFFRRRVAVETKAGKTDVVTRADRDAQRQVIAAVRTEYAEDAVVGEEEDELKEVPETGAAWIIDPVDGTNNFVREIPVWATSVAAVVDGRPVAAANVLPELGDVYTADAEGAYRNGEAVSVSAESDPEAMMVAPTLWWDRNHRDAYAAACRETVERFGDLRRVGSAQATLSMVAAGSLDGAFTNLSANPWDAVAGALLVERAGGTVTDLAGEPWRHDARGLVASNGRAHDQLLAAARAVEDVD
ncbi:inositol monophosphatase family protein [Halosegnis sp.]|uniref:inositol monophosphatase family protein n=1 Tax=Halosegnis sp. TaxID=2864959 RepID=UPI0035D4ABE2